MRVIVSIGERTAWSMSRNRGLGLSSCLNSVLECFRALGEVVKKAHGRLSSLPPYPAMRCSLDTVPDCQKGSRVCILLLRKDVWLHLTTSVRSNYIQRRQRQRQQPLGTTAAIAPAQCPPNAPVQTRDTPSPRATAPGHRPSCPDRRPPRAAAPCSAYGCGCDWPSPPGV